MSQRSVHSMRAGAAAGATIVGLAAFAHAAAGGHLSPRPLALSAVVAAALSTLLAVRVRLTFGRVLALSLLAQPLLHAALGHGSSPSSPTTGMAGHEHHGGMSTHAGTASVVDARMVIAHLAIAVIAALCVRSGAQWLRSMPALLREIFVVVRGLVVPLTMPSVPALRPAVLSVQPLLLSRSRDARGPPV